jgi:SAM-dependent methyltransferase
MIPAMSSAMFVRRLALPVVLSALAVSPVLGQTQTAQPFEPTVGQAGKDVVWVPTPQPLVEKMLDLAKISAQDVHYDLGSGDGRTVITAAKRGARSFGIEYNPDMVELSKRNATSEKVADRATFAQADIFQSDFSSATVLTLFLLPDLNVRLRPTILNMKPGTRVVSNTFTMGDWEADETATVPDCSSWCTALFWVVPAKVEGTWKMQQGELKLTQTYQKLSGTLGNTQIANGRMRGDVITFEVGSARYEGRVSGNTIQGSVRGGTGTSFTATKS